jgi:hypothetical protein
MKKLTAMVVSDVKPNISEVWLHDGRVEWFSNGTWTNTDISLEEFKEDVNIEFESLKAERDSILKKLETLENRIKVLEKNDNG